MKIQWKDKFKDDYQKLKMSKSLKKAIIKAISMLQLEKDLSTEFTVNRLVSEGAGWFICYLDQNIVMIYKLQGQYIKLARIGTAKDLGKGK